MAGAAPRREYRVARFGLGFAYIPQGSNFRKRGFITCLNPRMQGMAVQFQRSIVLRAVVAVEFFPFLAAG